VNALKRPVVRKTTDRIHERGRDREVVISLEPPNLICVRLAGLTQTLRITASALWWCATKAEVARQSSETTQARRVGRKAC